MDEMKIKSGLVFNKNEGRLVGFTDLGRVNSDIEHCLSNDRLLSSELSVHSGCTCWFTSNIPAVDYTVIYGKTAVWNI